MSDDAEMMVPFYIAANAALRGRAEAAEALAGDLAQAGAKAEAEIDALRARAEAAEQRAEDLAAELAQARAEGEAAGRAAERADVVAYLRDCAAAHDGLGSRQSGNLLRTISDAVKTGAGARAADGVG